MLAQAIKRKSTLILRLILYNAVLQHINKSYKHLYVSFERNKDIFWSFFCRSLW